MPTIDYITSWKVEQTNQGSLFLAPFLPLQREGPGEGIYEMSTANPHSLFAACEVDAPGLKEHGVFTAGSKTPGFGRGFFCVGKIDLPSYTASLKPG